MRAWRGFSMHLERQSWLRARARNTLLPGSSDHRGRVGLSRFQEPSERQGIAEGGAGGGVVEYAPCRHTCPAALLEALSQCGKGVCVIFRKIAPRRAVPAVVD